MLRQLAIVWILLIATNGYAEKAGPANNQDRAQATERVHLLFQKNPTLKGLYVADEAAYFSLIDNIVNQSGDTQGTLSLSIKQQLDNAIQSSFTAKLRLASDRLVVSYYRLLLKQATRGKQLDNCFSAEPAPSDSRIMQKLIAAVLTNANTHQPRRNKSPKFDAMLLKVMGPKGFAALYTKLLAKQSPDCQEQYWLYTAALSLPTPDAAATLRSFHPKN